jgi:hypothetical protein
MLNIQRTSLTNRPHVEITFQSRRKRKLATNLWREKMERLELATKKLSQVINEMSSPKFYYAQPQGTHMTQIASSKQREWISRLSMIQNELGEA